MTSRSLSQIQLEFKFIYIVQMVYASTLESRAVTQRWEDLHQVLVEMELDGMSLPAIPTDWLLRVVDRLLDAVCALDRLIWLYWRVDGCSLM